MPPELPPLPAGPKRMLEKVKRRAAAGKKESQETEPLRNESAAAAEEEEEEEEEEPAVQGSSHREGEGDSDNAAPRKLSLKEKLSATRSAIKEKVKSSQEKLKETKPVAHLLARTSAPRGGMSTSTFVSKMDPSRKVFYVNITVLDASAAVQEKVTQTLEEKTAKLPPIAKRVTSRVAEKVAQSLPPSKVAQGVSEKMLKVLPLKMKQAGLLVVAEKVFSHNAYFVLQLQVQHVDMATLIREAGKKKKKKEGEEDSSNQDEELEALLEKQQEEEEEEEEEAAAAAQGEAHPNNVLTTTTTSPLTTVVRPSCWSRLLDCVLRCLKWTGGQYRMQEKLLPMLIQNKLCNDMEEMLSKKMDGKKIQASVKVLSEEYQARYFFQHLAELTSVAAAAAAAGVPAANAGPKLE